MASLDKVYKQIEDFARECDAEKVVLFGSRARGNNLPKSDIDIAVAGCRDFGRFSYLIEERLDTLLDVDVVNLDESLSQQLLDEIARDGVILYEKYENFASALANLEDAPNQDLNNDFVQSGLINKFNLQFELSWKLLKRLLEYEGATLAASGSPRAILKEAYRFYDFIDEAAWLDMLRDRNTNVHIYDNKLAQDLIQRILNAYIPAFCQLRDGLMERYGELLLAPDDQFV